MTTTPRPSAAGTSRTPPPSPPASAATSAPAPAAAPVPPHPVTIPPPGFEYGEARRRYVEAFGSTQVMNTYLKLALLALSVVAVGLIALAFNTQRVYGHVKIGRAHV